MNRSDSIAKLAEALAKAQGNMGKAVKGSANPFFKSKYADLAAVVDAIRQPFAENGLSYVQGADTDEQGNVTVETILMHVSGEWISSRLTMKPAKNDPQGVGSTISYIRRYSLQSMAGLATEDDDGNTATGNGQPAAGAKAHIQATAAKLAVVGSTTPQQ